MTILLATNVPFVKKSMKKLLQLENLYHQEKFSIIQITNIFTLSKLHDISFHIALQRLPFTAFQNQLALEKLYGVKFTSCKVSCKNFIFGISECLFEKNKKKKLHLVNFIAILCDGSTDNSAIEQEVLHVIFVDPETFKPTMKFSEVVAPADSQDAPGLKTLFLQHFINILLIVLNKIVFLSSDVASVNSGEDSG